MPTLACSRSGGQAWRLDPRPRDRRTGRSAEAEVNMPDGHVAFYARVSTEGQARDNTIASQITALRERIAVDGGQLEPDDAYVDEGYSGSVLVRPALERLRDAAAAVRVGRLCVVAPLPLGRGAPPP